MMTRSNESLKGKLLGRRDQPWGLVSPRNTRRIGCINVCTLGKDTDSRAEMAMDVLAGYGLAICGISETRYGGFGRKRMGDYDLFYSGDKPGSYGVGIAVRANLVGSMSCWEPVSDRLMWMRFNAKNAPTEPGEVEHKDKFYMDLTGGA